MTSPLIRESLMTIAAAAMMIPTAALAADAPTGLTVKSTTNGIVKMSVKAFKKGDYERSARLSKKALKAGMSKNRRAIAYTNLCAAEAALGNMEAATEACDTALDLRPGYDFATANKSALTVLLAQK